MTTIPRVRGGVEGSVLMLVPAGVLVLLILAAISVDSAVILLAQRDLASRTAAAANDGAAAGVADDAFYTDGGRIELDGRRADAIVALAFEPEARPPGYRWWSASSSVDGRMVRVEAVAEVDHIFAKAIPGVRRSTVVRASSTAEATGG